MPPRPENERLQNYQIPNVSQQIEAFMYPPRDKPDNLPLHLACELIHTMLTKPEYLIAYTPLLTTTPEDTLDSEPVFMPHTRVRYNGTTRNRTYGEKILISF